MKKTQASRATTSARTRALLGAVSTLAIALGIVIDGSAAANEQPSTATPIQGTATSARDARGVGVLIASRLKSDSSQHKMQSDQQKTQAGFTKLESGRFKTEGHQLKYESRQDKWTPADSNHKLNPQPLPPGLKRAPEDQQ